MIFYWFLYVVPVALTLLPFRANRNLKLLNGIIICLFFTIIIGLRWQIGTDWENYLPIMESARGVDFLNALPNSDPAYMMINWLSLKAGFDIVGINLVCAAIFVCGLYVFCKRQPLPWLAFSIAVPYLLIVVAMGYTRQSAALGFVFAALICLQDKRVYSFVLLIILGALFHKTAVVLLPLITLIFGKRKRLSMLFGLLLVTFVGVALVIDSLSSQWSMYVEEQMQSDGAGVRIIMNLIPAVLLFIFRNFYKSRWPDSYSISKWLAISAIVCIPLLQVASTATDRLALYVAPLQLMLFSRLPLMTTGAIRALTLLSIIFYYGLVLFVWLNYSFYAQNYWIPYQWPKL